jgi:hypothetical protein
MGKMPMAPRRLGQGCPSHLGESIRAAGCPWHPGDLGRDARATSGEHPGSRMPMAPQRLGQGCPSHLGESIRAAGCPWHPGDLGRDAQATSGRASGQQDAHGILKTWAGMPKPPRGEHPGRMPGPRCAVAPAPPAPTPAPCPGRRSHTGDRTLARRGNRALSAGLLPRAANALWGDAGLE